MERMENVDSLSPDIEIDAARLWRKPVKEDRLTQMSKALLVSGALLNLLFGVHSGLSLLLNCNHPAITLLLALGLEDVLVLVQPE